jgi:CheY-like chemotaxis protein
VSDRSVILLCEDNREDAFLLRHAFAKAGLSHAIVDVRNGQQAINYLNGTGLYTNRLQHPLPNLVLLDLKMPLMDGFEVLAWIQTRAELKALPIIVLSGSSDATDIEAARKLGAHDYLIKPKDWDELIKFARLLHERYTSKPLAAPTRPSDTAVITPITHPRQTGCT